MKKLLAIALILTVVATAVWLSRDAISFYLTRISLKPDQPFAASTAPAAAHYAEENAWAALPWREDSADSSPAKLALDRQYEAQVDVFFVHPTTYYSAEHWNQPLDDVAANSLVDTSVLPMQASVFNSCCRIFAPRYRQATLYAFFEDSTDTQGALELAYADVERAFAHYLEHFNEGRPFILAGHSQGSLHVSKLLRADLTASAMDRLVAAYPIGFPVTTRGSLPACESADQTQCQVSYNSYAPEQQAYRNTAEDLCINPVTWRMDNEPSTREQHAGAISLGPQSQLFPALLTAQCRDGVLRIELNNDSEFPPGKLGYHIYDYNFFYMDLRTNVQQRINAYLQRSMNTLSSTP
jgi:hypothetical protein